MRTALLQHGGSEGGLTAGVVRVGGKIYPDAEKIGQAPADGLGANVHASIDGTVTEASDCIVIVGSEGRRQ